MNGLSTVWERSRTENSKINVLPNTRITKLKELNLMVMFPSPQHYLIQEPIPTMSLTPTDTVGGPPSSILAMPIIKSYLKEFTPSRKSSSSGN